MAATPIRSIAVVGGGTAGWLAAAMLARALPGTGTVITVVESPEIGTVGVGEATIPPILDLLRFLSIDEADFIRHTQATYKLGIKFVDWRAPGHGYWHPFGTFGAAISRRPFHHWWQRARVAGLAPRFEDYSACAALGEAGKFRKPDPDPAAPGAGLRYALHFDAILVARYLRSYAERLGVVRLERTVQGAALREDGFIGALHFTDRSTLAADLYIDCSGFRGVLIEGALGTGYVDWSHWLPCDRAVAFPTVRPAEHGATADGGRLPPYTLSRARAAGWQWRIPLQHRTGNGYVYSSAHCTDQAALDDLLATTGAGRGADAAPLAEPRKLRFVTGRRRLYWNRNCVALGLASGFLEPLESTSIHLVTSGLNHLLEHFPDSGFDQANIDSYNADLIEEAERVRDFIVLHYCLTRRDDAPLWNDCRTMALPDTLAERIEMYRRTGRIRPRAGELFTDSSWFYVFDGMGVVPEGCDPLTAVVPIAKLREILAALSRDTAVVVGAAPAHADCFKLSADQRCA